LFEDRVDAARRTVESVEQGWPEAIETPTYRFVLGLTRSRIARYTGDGVASLAAIEAERRPIERAMMLTKEPLRIFMAHDRGCAAMLAAWCSSGRDRARALAVARHEADRLLGEPPPWLPIVAAHEAALGRRALATRTLEASTRAFLELGMAAYAAASMRRTGELTESASVVARADARATQCGAVAPESLARLLVPPVTGW
jgi:hypothetical protein